MDSSSSSLILDWCFYLDNEPRLLGWTPDFLRCWIKWYPEFLSDSQLLLSISYLFGHFFLLHVSKQITQRRQEEVPWHRGGSHTKISKGWIWPNHPVVFLYFQVEQAHVSPSALYAINISLPLCPDVFLLLSFVWTEEASGETGRSRGSEAGPGQLRCHVGEAGRNPLAMTEVGGGAWWQVMFWETIYEGRHKEN